MQRVLKQNSIRSLHKIYKNTSSSSQINTISKRTFFSGGGGASFIPQIIKYCVAGNFFIYFIGSRMPDGQYIREFLFNKNAFLQGKYHSIITNHFTKTNIFDLLLDSLITVGLGTNISMTAGEILLKQVLMYGIGISSLIMLFGNNDNTYYKCDSVLRSLIWLLVLKNPNQSFTLLPFPIQIKAMYIGLLIAGIDLLSGKYCNFGGAIAALILTRGRI